MKFDEVKIESKTFSGKNKEMTSRTGMVTLERKTQDWLRNYMKLEIQAKGKRKVND